MPDPKTRSLILSVTYLPRSIGSALPVFCRPDALFLSWLSHRHLTILKQPNPTIAAPSVPLPASHTLKSFKCNVNERSTHIRHSVLPECISSQPLPCSDCTSLRS